MHQGNHGNLPLWARWLAQDADGRWWAYEHEPHRHEHGWYENEVGRSKCVGSSSANDWPTSLRPVNQDEIK